MRSLCVLKVPTSSSFVRRALRWAGEGAFFGLPEAEGEYAALMVAVEEGLYPWETAAVVAEIAAGFEPEERKRLSMRAGSLAADLYRSTPGGEWIADLWDKEGPEAVRAYLKRSTP